MARAPKPPPITEPVTDKDGRLSQAWYKYFTGGVSYSQNVNSGVSEALAAAAAAQATANAASQTAQDTQSNAFTVTVDSPYAVVLSSSTGTLTTTQVSVTPSGGTAPYTYAWAKVTGDTVSINAPTAATTDFSGTPASNETLAGEYRCTVTDNAAATASITVGVSIGNILITG